MCGLKCFDVAVNTAQDKCLTQKANPTPSIIRTCTLPTSKKLVYRMSSLSQFHRLESCGFTRTTPAVLCRPSLERRVLVVPSKLGFCISRVKRPLYHRLLELQLERNLNYMLICRRDWQVCRERKGSGLAVVVMVWRAGERERARDTERNLCARAQLALCRAVMPMTPCTPSSLAHRVAFASD
jgi:hypothetical protein